jgi:quinol-cytochrome oxidoreductase complex cytochrome b subunit
MNLELMSLSEAAANFNVLLAIGLFVLYSLVEFLDSSLTLSITRHESLKSANTTLILYIILGIEVLAFVSNYLYTIPIALGAWLGTYILVEREKKVRPLKKNTPIKD